MSFGIYVHIPYCIQKCRYCDFTTFPLDHKVTMQNYTDTLLRELELRHPAIQHKTVNSIYFGGGTPSLLPAADILTIVNKISTLGFKIESDAEITIEINPGTIDEKKLDLYRAAGVNRFSVGVQTFHDRLLRVCGREHSAEDSHRTLRFLAKHRLNYSFDLLFGLPQQSLRDLQDDIEKLREHSPPHVSTYIMNVPESHPMNRQRAPEEQQAEMFHLVEQGLSEIGLLRYEISNFAKAGFESRHNMIYWTDESYWGIGISSHSYFRHRGPFGTRFWNPTSASEYITQVETIKAPSTFIEGLPDKQKEELRPHEALTDFLHTQLRRMSGLSIGALSRKFDATVTESVVQRLDRLIEKDLVEKSAGENYRLTLNGLKLANQVFLDLTFLEI